MVSFECNTSANKFQNWVGKPGGCVAITLYFNVSNLQKSEEVQITLTNICKIIMHALASFVL